MSKNKPRWLRSKRVWIHLALGEFRQPNVGLLFLLKALMQHLLIIAQVELASQVVKSSVTSRLILANAISCDRAWAGRAKCYSMN